MYAPLSATRAVSDSPKAHHGVDFSMVASWKEAKECAMREGLSYIYHDYDNDPKYVQVGEIVGIVQKWGTH